MGRLSRYLTSLQCTGWTRHCVSKRKSEAEGQLKDLDARFCPLSVARLSVVFEYWTKTIPAVLTRNYTWRIPRAMSVRHLVMYVFMLQSFFARWSAMSRSVSRALMAHFWNGDWSVSFNFKYVWNTRVGSEMEVKLPTGVIIFLGIYPISSAAAAADPKSMEITQNRLRTPRTVTH